MLVGYSHSLRNASAATKVLKEIFMKSRLILVLLAVFVVMSFLLTSCATTDYSDVNISPPFSKGVNMLTWFETWDENKLPDLNKFDEADFACLKNMGVDVMRLAVHFELLMEPLYTGKIKERVFEKLDEVCDWAEKYQIYLVIDNHSFNSEEWDGNPPSWDLNKEHLESVWSQVAQRYKYRSEYIIYEIRNEPEGRGEVTPEKWVKLQGEIIDVIRTYDTKHAIVVSGSDFSSIDTLAKMKPYEDPNLIYTFHFYEPMLFTHQGATWIGEGFSETSGIPFPYDRSKMPKLSSSAKQNPWLVDMYNNYSQLGTEKYINSRIKKAANWAKKNNVRIWCGEIGAKIWTNAEDRLAWISTTVSVLNKYGIPYCTWGIDGSDGFLNGDTGSEIFPDDIDKDALEAYGFSMPNEALAAQCNSLLKQFPQKPFIVHDGFAGKGTSFGIFGSVASTTSYDSHQECMKVSLPGENNNGCYFQIAKRIRDEIIENKDDLCISLSVKFTNKNQSFTIGLVDNDEGEAALPWAVEYGLKASDYDLYEWIDIEIPLTKFYETGAWSGITQKWYSPEGKFDWSRLNQLRILFNDFENAMSGDIYIDDVVIKMK